MRLRLRARLRRSKRHIRKWWYKVFYGVRVSLGGGTMFASLGKGRFVSVYRNGPYIEIVDERNKKDMIRLIPYQPNHGIMVEHNVRDDGLGEWSVESRTQLAMDVLMKGTYGKADAKARRRRAKRERALREQLGHARGALSDIETLVTSCVSRDAPEETKEIAKTILSRILSSADCVRTKPSWYIHGYEAELWGRYEIGDVKACADDRPCIEVASGLAECAGGAERAF